MSEDRKEPIDLSGGYPKTQQKFDPITPSEHLKDEDERDRVCPKKVKEGPVPPDTMDLEVVAIQAVLNALGALGDVSQRVRVLNYAASRSTPGFLVVPRGALIG